MAIHACRSIHAAPKAIHKRGVPPRSGGGESAGRGQDLLRPRDGNGPGGALPARCPEKIRVFRAPRESKPNRSAESGIRNPARPEKTTRAKRALGIRESKNARA